jgi:hypothetical protein
MQPASKVAGVFFCLVFSVPAISQAPKSDPDLAVAVRELQAEVRELRSAVLELRTESVRYRQEAIRLRQQVEQESATQSSPVEAASASKGSPEERLSALEEDHELLKSKVDEQYQTKVESASKYRVRLSGIVLLNAFSDRGNVDSIDVPSIATRRTALGTSGSLGATLRQSQIGLEAFGPTLWGARTSADIQFDFAGGFAGNPQTGLSSGLVRLRTGAVHIDWDRLSVIAGQDALFIAPNAPTSFASLAIPALSYSGNLWSWVPQIRMEYRLNTSEQSRFTFQAGVLDALTAEAPSSEYLRLPTAGESSRTPAVATRVAWSHRALGRDMTVGAASYYSRQDWGFGRTVNAWAGMSDWLFPLASWLRVSGAFYRGDAIGGLGGGIGQTVVFNGDPANPAASANGLKAMGGWTQLKFIAAPKLEFNAAIGQDNPFAHDFRGAIATQEGYTPLLARNRSALVNTVYRPRSDLLLSLELRRLQTFRLSGGPDSANQVNLAMGFLF